MLAGVAAWLGIGLAFYSWFLFWLMNFSLGANSLILMRRVFDRGEAGIRLVQFGLLSTAHVVLSEIVLGYVGLLTVYHCLIWQVAFLAFQLILNLVRPLPTEATNTSSEGRVWSIGQYGPASWVGVPALLALTVFLLVVGFRSPPSEYDSLTYHLVFPVHWLQDHTLKVIHTPFGDQAPAYAPSNVELVWLWLLLPLHSDFLAKVGQFPFWLLAAVILYGLCREFEWRPNESLLASLCFLGATPIALQSISADVDVAWTCFFFAALLFLIRSAKDHRVPDIFLFGLSLGLYLGTKFVGLVYLPLLLVPLGILAWKSERRGLWLWALPAVGALAGYWYLRNVSLTGSPIYPASLEVFGFSLADGAYSHQVMQASPFHLGDLAYLPDVLASAFGHSLLWILLPFLVAANILTWFCPVSQRWMVRYLLGLPLLLIPLYWYGIPYNSEFRFLFPAVGVVALSVAYCMTIAERHFFRLGLTLCLLVGLVWQGVGGLTPVVAGRPLAFLGLFIPAWQWVHGQGDGLSIAYAGNNIPYFLFGPRLSNSVNYVNIDSHRDWLFHDYDLAARSAGDWLPPLTPKPAYERRAPDFSAWTGNLKAKRIQLLFITVLHPNEAAYLWHNDEGFPIEEEWAKGHPELFQGVYQNPVVRIYRFEP